MPRKTKSALTRLPADNERNPTVSQDIDKFINKGLKTDEPETKPKKNQPEEISRIQLRLPKSKIAEIDLLLSERDVKVSRHVWFLEAIEEKLKKEQC